MLAMLRLTERKGGRGDRSLVCTLLFLSLPGVVDVLAVSKPNIAAAPRPAFASSLKLPTAARIRTCPPICAAGLECMARADRQRQKARVDFESLFSSVSSTDGDAHSLSQRRLRAVQLDREMQGSIEDTRIADKEDMPFGLNAIRTARGRTERKSGKYVCMLCNCAFGKLKNFDEHINGKQHKINSAVIGSTWISFQNCSDIWQLGGKGTPGGVEGKDVDSSRTFSVGGESVALMDVVKAWSSEELQIFPMRASGEGCMSPATQFQDLSLLQKARLHKYISELMPYYPELPCIMADMAAKSPQHFRVKELFESFEAFKLLENFIVAAKKYRNIDRIFDVACGHGLVGMLLAYRFPAMQIVGVDVAIRPALKAWEQSFRVHGQKLDEWQTPLENFEFVNGAVEDLERIAKESSVAYPERNKKNIGMTGLDAHCLAVAVHGCNEVNRVAIETAIGAESLWATLPCCVPEQLYTPSTIIRLSDDLNDNARHVFMCGVMAERYNAQFVAQIDRTITNRAIMIAGGVVELPSSSSGQDPKHPCGRPIKLMGFSRKIAMAPRAFGARNAGD